MEAGSSAPILSTPAEHILQEPVPVAVQSSQLALADDDLYVQYEIERTVEEVRVGGWKQVALQFPDEMLVDAPRVFERLQNGLQNASSEQHPGYQQDVGREQLDGLANQLNRASLLTHDTSDANKRTPKLTILGDTSYGACCVDEVAAEHVEADVVVHYGRTCLSPTARLPVIYVYTTKPLDLSHTALLFKQSYQDLDEKVCLMADIPYAHHVAPLALALQAGGYTNVFPTQVLREPASPLPNRTLPEDVCDNHEKLREYSIFHISSPPTSLLLNLSSSVKSIHVLPTDAERAREAPEALSIQLLRRRYALVTRLSTASVFGILINTLSVASYMSALKHVQNIIRQAGKKSYTFVVGKVNAAKVANFAEIEGWVVIGCWESSLIESKDFWRPIITPFELEVALTGDGTRTWGREWISDFSTLLARQIAKEDGKQRSGMQNLPNEDIAHGSKSWDDQPSDDEPPEFDLRTGRHVSNTRPMGRPEKQSQHGVNGHTVETTSSAVSSSALVQRARGDVATVGGTVSPAAEFLRSKRTWQGLGSDYEIAYERDEDGKIRGAPMEEGRSGVAQGYAVGNSEKG